MKFSIWQSNRSGKRFIVTNYDLSKESDKIHDMFKALCEGELKDILCSNKELEERYYPDDTSEAELFPVIMETNTYRT